MACHASADLESAIPGYQKPAQPAGAAAQQGIDVHEIYEDIWSLELAQIRGIAATVQYVADLMKGRRFNRLIEHEFKAGWISGSPPSKPDLILYTQTELHIIDTKNGKHPVEVAGNSQLMYYAVCAAEAGIAPKAKGAHLHILQPHANNMSTWFASSNAIGKFMADAQAADEAISKGSRTFGPSDYCVFCDANPHKRGGQKGKPCCPVMLDLLYPNRVDEDAILNG
jgi:hypothetical protein